MMSIVGDAIPWAGGLGCLRKPVKCEALMGLQRMAPALDRLCLSSSSCFCPECFNTATEVKLDIYHWKNSLVSHPNVWRFWVLAGEAVG